MAASMFSRFADGLRNALTGLGSSVDSRRGFSYAPTFLTEYEALAAYRGSGNLRKVIDIPAVDCVREWRDWQAEQDEIADIEAEEKRLDIRAKIGLAETYRGIGGGALVLGLPGVPSEPAPAIISTRQLAFVHVVTRWQLTLGDEDTDYASPTFGGPKFFRLTTAGQGSQLIHPSRIIPFTAEPIPGMAGASWDDRFWGDSAMQRSFDAARNLDNALANFSALIGKARISVYSIPGLADIVATPEGETNLANRLQNAVLSESNFGATIIDAGDGREGSGEKIEHRQVTWTGIPEIIRVFAEALSASSDIPMTRLWGKSADGMNASGEGQQTDWQKMVKARQELRLRPCMEKLDAYLLPSAGVTNPDIWWQFAPLDTPSQEKETARFKTAMEAVEKLQGTMAIPEAAFNAGVQGMVIENGWMPGIEAELDKLSDDERLGVSAGGDDDDPADLETAKGGGQNLPSTGSGTDDPARANEGVTQGAA